MIPREEIHGRIRIGNGYLRSVIEVSVGESGSVAIPVSRRDDYDKLEIEIRISFMRGTSLVGGVRRMIGRVPRDS